MGHRRDMPQETLRVGVPALAVTASAAAVWALLPGRSH
jgi:hypothetical protein